MYMAPEGTPLLQALEHSCNVPACLSLTGLCVRDAPHPHALCMLSVPQSSCLEPGCDCHLLPYMQFPSACHTMRKQMCSHWCEE